MMEYFLRATAAAGYHGRPRTSLPVLLESDLHLIVMQLKSRADLTGLGELTRGRNGRLRWQGLTTEIRVAAQAM